MKLKCFASSSSGNLYKIESDHTQILVECGLSMKDIRSCLGLTINNITAVLLSHEHQDHAKAVKDLLHIGIDVYTSKGTAEALGIATHPNVHIIKSEQAFFIKDLIIMPFAIKHDAAEPLGFIVRDKEDMLLFATDTYNIEININEISILVIECNHSYKLIDENVASGCLNKILAKRLVKSHMSLENLKLWLSKADLSKLKEIYLVHLSKLNSNAEEFKKEIQSFTGIPTYIADENILKTKRYYIPSDTWEKIPGESDFGRTIKKLRETKCARKINEDF